MNDPVQPAPADALEARRSFGDAFKSAREQAGMSPATLAGRLRLSPRQIEALERCDLEALPSRIYVRGFVRGCARELKIDPAPLLADLDRATGSDATVDRFAPEGAGVSLARIAESSRPLVFIALGGLLLAGVVGALWPRHAQAPALHAGSAAPGVALAEPSAAVSAPAPTPAPATAANAERAAPAPASVPALAHAPVAPPVSIAPAAAVPGAPTAAPAGAQSAAHGAAAAPAVTAAVPAASGAATARGLPMAVPLAAGSTHAAAGAAPASGAAADAHDTAAVLVLRMRATAWVEVVQADGATLLSQVCPIGSMQTVKGKAPLRVVVGNAASVDAVYRGAPIDLGRGASANGVARVTLD